MSWHDPARSLEPEAETALRNELRGLLGMPAPATSYFETEPTPELVSLADDLRREALRRNRTARKRSSWMLLAAALPFALALGGVGVWGVSQKHKAEQLAAAVAQQQVQIQRLAAAVAQPVVAPARPAAPAAPMARSQAPQVLLVGQTAPRNKAKELVIPVQRSAEPSADDTQRVKVH
jgi:outer membrane murein-binding lipoprotein Lpp